MIFITLGSQKFQFNRLLKAVDKLKTNDEIFAQIGYSDYKPQNYKYKEFLDRDEFSNMMSKTRYCNYSRGHRSNYKCNKKRQKSNRCS